MDGMEWITAIVSRDGINQINGQFTGDMLGSQHCTAGQVQVSQGTEL